MADREKEIRERLKAATQPEYVRFTEDSVALLQVPLSLRRLYVSAAEDIAYLLAEIERLRKEFVIEKEYLKSQARRTW